jgi:hypothetical protein
MEQQVFTVRIEGFALPKNVKRKWEQGREAAASARNATLENLEIKLQAAEQRREVSIVQMGTRLGCFCVCDSNRALGVTAARVLDTNIKLFRHNLEILFNIIVQSWQ